jgi:hypothetical protein
MSKEERRGHANGNKDKTIFIKDCNDMKLIFKHSLLAIIVFVSACAPAVATQPTNLRQNLVDEKFALLDTETCTGYETALGNIVRMKDSSEYGHSDEELNTLSSFSYDMLESCENGHFDHQWPFWKVS